MLLEDGGEGSATLPEMVALLPGVFAVIENLPPFPSLHPNPRLKALPAGPLSPCGAEGHLTPEAEQQDVTVGTQGSRHLQAPIPP